MPGGAWPSAPTASSVEVRATHTVLATGGAGQLFAVTTNPAEATADGLAMALRAGVPVADVEFMQFHPTALHHPAMPRPLLSEALRGHGALLRDADAASDSSTSWPPATWSAGPWPSACAVQGVESLWLDATGLASFDSRFPTIAASLRAIGLDPAHDWLPIAPAAHYLSGGVLTDLSGATALPGLWAAGEVACTGVHGANRLASNSLLEGMVFGARLAESILAGDEGPSATGAMAGVPRRDRCAARPGGRPPGGAGRSGRACGRTGGRSAPWPDVTKDPRPAAAGDDRGGRRGPQRRVARTAGSWTSRPSPSPPDRGRPADRAHGELANLVTAAASLLRSADAPERDPRRPRPQRPSPRHPTGGGGASSTPGTASSWSAGPHARTGTTDPASRGVRSLTAVSEGPAATDADGDGSIRRMPRWSRPWPGPSPRTCYRWAT